MYKSFYMNMSVQGIGRNFFYLSDCNTFVCFL